MIIIDEVTNATILKKTFEDEMPDVIMVNINYVDDQHQRRVGRRGLDIALEKYEVGKPMILYSFESEDTLREDERFQHLIHKPNVAFLRLPASFDKYRNLYTQLRN